MPEFDVCPDCGLLNIECVCSVPDRPAPHEDKAEPWINAEVTFIFPLDIPVDSTPHEVFLEIARRLEEAGVDPHALDGASEAFCITDDGDSPGWNRAVEATRALIARELEGLPAAEWFYDREHKTDRVVQRLNGDVLVGGRLVLDREKVLAIVRGNK